MSNTLILPMQELTWLAESQLIRWMRSRDVVRPHPDFYRELVVAVVESALNQRLVWSKRIDSLDAVLEKLPWFTKNCELSDDFYTQICYWVIDRVNDWMEQLIPEQTWSTWTMRQINAEGDVVFEQGEDYRVMEYYRLVETYEPVRAEVEAYEPLTTMKVDAHTPPENTTYAGTS